VPKRDPLDEYRAKRTPAKTPEPAGRASRPNSQLAVGGFVVHKHAARRLHYDLRLEMNGVLKSWAVPKGPSLDPADKRLAVHVEDHPIEYIDFEDVIPAGSYGAGAMIVWDIGTWRPLEDPVTGLETGKLLFELRGYKLRGVWTLVKLKKSDNEWLMIREKKYTQRGPGDPGGVDDLPPESVHSGLTVEQLGEEHDLGAELQERLEELGAPRRTMRASTVKMMLARSRREPFSKPAWIFELKLDGYRMLGGKSAAGVELITRNGNDATPSFPELAAAIAALPYDELILDGEVVAHDDAGLPSFQRLQKRARLTRAIDIERASRHQPTTFYVFDILAALGHDLRSLPLTQRKQLLQSVLPPTGPLRYVEHFEEAGEDLFRRVVGLGLEGIVGKKGHSRYRGARSGDWIKVRADRTADFVIVGYTLPKGSRTGFGALHLGGYQHDELCYAGRVGTGFSNALLRSLRETLDELQRETPPFNGPTPTGGAHCWVEPELVCEVRYLEATEEGLLRQPAFLRLRDDKVPTECDLPWGDEDQPALPANRVRERDATNPENEQPAAAEVRLSNPDKVFWPSDGYTKRDLFDYYRKIAPALLPYLRDRPLVLTRFPDGIEGDSFYQKNTPGFVPDWIRTVPIWSEHSERELAYVVCDDLATLLYLANMATIPLHIWASRVESLDHPDWCILDLDPKDAPFENVVEVARAIGLLCREINLPAYIKTSGSTGLHVLVPLDGRFDYAMSRALGELLSQVVVARHPEIATLTRTIADREGKVYLDYLQNRRGQLLVAPFSVRPIEGAPVSTPLKWSEIKKGLDIHRYTIRSVPRRVGQLKTDPFRGVLEDTPDLLAALEQLQAKLPS
jgi:bifunctional non-homologous end joining protein LigD